MPIQTPEVVPGGLAICGKTAVGGLLDPSKLVEWFEVQRALGVDRIQIFDLDNPEKVLKVFRHYQELGLLVLLPYKLPGKSEKASQGMLTENNFSSFEFSLKFFNLY